MSLINKTLLSGMSKIAFVFFFQSTFRFYNHNCVYIILSSHQVGHTHWAKYVQLLIFGGKNIFLNVMEQIIQPYKIFSQSLWILFEVPKTVIQNVLIPKNRINKSTHCIRYGKRHQQQERSSTLVQGEIGWYEKKGFSDVGGAKGSRTHLVNETRRNTFLVFDWCTYVLCVSFLR